MKEIIRSSLLTRIIIILGALLIVLIIFGAGMAVGYRKAQFTSDWGNHYTDMFGGMRSPFAINPDADEISSADGAAGKVVAVNLPTVAVKGPNEVEKVIVIGPATVIRQFRDPATTTDIHIGDTLIGIGEPDSQGRIVATFVRLIPPPPGLYASSSQQAPQQ